MASTSTPPRRAARPPPSKASDDVILDAAAELLSARWRRVRIEDITERAGVSKALLFYRFGSRDGLLAAMLERVESVPESLDELAARPGTGDLRARFVEVGSVIVRAVRRLAPLVVMAYSGPDDATIEKWLIRAGAVLEERVEAVSRWLSAEVAARRLRALDPHFVARLMFGAALQRVVEEHLVGRTPDVAGDAAFVQTLADAVVHGAVGPRQRPGRQGVRRGTQRRTSPQ